MAEQVDAMLDAAREQAIDDVDADVFVLLQRVGGGEQECGAEQIPLQFQPGVGRHVEGLADDRIAGADQHGTRMSQETHLPMTSLTDL